MIFGGGAAILFSQFASGEAATESSPIRTRLRHSRSRLRRQNKNTRARNPASYADYMNSGQTTCAFSTTDTNKTCFIFPKNVNTLTMLTRLNLFDLNGVFWFHESGTCCVFDLRPPSYLEHCTTCFIVASFLAAEQ